MSKKDKEIKDLKEERLTLQYDLELVSEELLSLRRQFNNLSALYSQATQKAPEIPTTKKYKPLIKNDRWWSVQIELWPGAWTLHYYRYDWRKHDGTAREGQINLGPFGFSWFREPKK